MKRAIGHLLFILFATVIGGASMLVLVTTPRDCLHNRVAVDSRRREFCLEWRAKNGRLIDRLTAGFGK